MHWWDVCVCVRVYVCVRVRSCKYAQGRAPVRRRLAAGSYASLRRLEAAEAAWAAAGYEARLHLRPGALHACVCVCVRVCVCLCLSVAAAATRPASTSAPVRGGPVYSRRCARA